MSQTKSQLVAPVGILTASGVSVTGVVTASQFVGSGATINASGIVAGVVTATSFVGSGATINTSGIVAGVVTATIPEVLIVAPLPPSP